MTLKHLIQISHSFHGPNLDNKFESVLDVKLANIILLKNFQYEAKARKWVKKDEPNAVKFFFMVRSRSDDGLPHQYPIYILIKDLSKGLDSEFQLRAGAIKKPEFPKKVPAGATKDLRQRMTTTNKAIALRNLQRGIQFDFFFNSMFLFAESGILFGPDTTNGHPPLIKNPRGILALDKHSLYVIEKILLRLLGSSLTLLQDKVNSFNKNSSI